MSELVSVKHLLTRTTISLMLKIYGDWILLVSRSLLFRVAEVAAVSVYLVWVVKLTETSLPAVEL